MSRRSVRTFFILSLTLGSTALAQSEDQIIVIPKVTELDFSEQNVTASTEKPGLSLVSEIKGAQFSSMIPLRKNFDDSVDQSVDQIQ